MHASIVASRSGQARRERAKEGSSRYLLLDDVYTTGATLSACAAVLKRDFSASYVSALTVAMD
jgi:predicted amidophosphoribosyltransferase